jgi:hypothetical protein
MVDSLPLRIVPCCHENTEDKICHLPPATQEVYNIYCYCLNTYINTSPSSFCFLFSHANLILEHFLLDFVAITTYFTRICSRMNKTCQSIIFFVHLHDNRIPLSSIHIITLFLRSMQNHTATEWNRTNSRPKAPVATLLVSVSNRALTGSHTIDLVATIRGCFSTCSIQWWYIVFCICFG